MNCLIVRASLVNDFCVIYEDDMRAGDVKDEMFKQIEIPTRKMKLIFNGKLLQDDVLLKDIGCKNGSILYLYIQKSNRTIFQTPNKLLVEIFSLFLNIHVIPPDTFSDAIKNLKQYMDSPVLKPLMILIPEIKEMFDQINDYLMDLMSPLDSSMIRAISKLHDESFYSSDLSDSCSYLPIDEQSETVSITDNLDEEFDSSDLDEELCVDFPEEPTVVNYSPSINSDPLPFFNIQDYCSIEFCYQ